MSSCPRMLSLLIEEVKRLLERFRVNLDPGLDEQQLVDAEVVGRLIEIAEVTDRDTVLEVGAGCGNITQALAEAAGRVITIEKNAKFFPMLEERMKPFGNVELIRGDALRMRLPSFSKLVSNLPYSICESFMQRLIRLDFESAAVIVSSSFAETVTAGVGDPRYSRLSLVANAFFTIERLGEVGPDAYYPPPGRSTAIIRLRPREVSDQRLAVLRYVLLQGDKKLKNALREALIASSKVFGSPSTKRAAKERVRSMRLSRELAEKRVARLSLPELELLFRRL